MLSQLQRHDTYPFAEQERFLRSIAMRDGNLASELEKIGLRYDDLAYEVSGPRVYNGPPALALTDFSSCVRNVPLVSFFTGCGGLDLGFEAVGYDHVASFEINELFCKTLRKNRPNWKVFGPPIHSGDVSKFEEVANTLRGLIKAPFEGVFAGGPPCQPFSIAANQRFAKWGDNFKRTGFAHAKNGNLLFDFVRLIIEFQPRAFVIENVPGLRDLDGGEQLSAAIVELTKAGYSVSEPKVVDAAHVGVPQYRQRLFVVGSRGTGEYNPPAPLNYTVGAGSVLFKALGNAKNHETREHKAASVLRYMSLAYGARDQLGRVDRLASDLPSKTVIAGGTSGGGRSHLHPEIPRTLSVRECARLQTFPDDYEFVGATARQFTQVGNAVPPVLGAWVGKAIAEAFF